MVVRWYIADMVDVLSKSIGICHILLLASCIYWTDSQVLSPCTDKNDGDPCLLSCQTPVVNQPITISQSPAYTNGGTCLGGNCFPADSNFNISQTGTTTTLEILSFKKSDNGTWRCEYGTIDTHSIFISWSKIPTSITELSGLTSNATITADLTISVEVGCLYSLQDPTVTLQLMCDGALASSYDMSSSPSTTVCSDSDLTAYICNYTMTSNPPSQTCNSGYTGYSLKALVSLFGTSKTYEKEIFPSFSVSFESDVTTEGTTKGLISATHSSETTSEMESSFLEVTGIVDISNVLPSFESTDFTSKPGTSINANTLSLEDSLPRISSLRSIGSLGPTDMLNNEYKTTGIEVDSTLFTLNTMNFTDETITITPGVFNGEISTSMVTSSRNNLQISSVSVLYITTGISFQIDFTQSRDLQIQTSEIIQNTQTQYTSLHSSVLLHTQTSNIQTSTIPSSLSTRFDATYSDALSLQSTSLDSFIISLVSKDKSSTVTFSVSIETFPASPVQPVDTSSINQLYTSGYSWSVNQTEQVPENTLIVETLTSYVNTFSSFQIASSSSEVQVLPSDTTSLGKDYSSDNLLSAFEGFSIPLLLYSSSLNERQPSIYTSINNTLALFDVSSISLMVHTSYLSDESVIQSSDTSLSNSFLSFTDTFTLDRNDQSANETVTSMVVQSLNLSSSNNQVSFSSHTLSGSQFLPFNGTSSSYQLKLIATSSVNHSSQSDALSEFSFPQLNTSITPQSSHANKVSNDLSATSMSFLSINTLTFRRSSQSLHLSTYNLNPSFDSAITEQPANTPFVSTEFQFTNTPLFTSMTVFLHTSSLGKLTHSTGLPFETISVFGDLAKESMSTTIHSLFPLSSFSNLKISSHTNVTPFSEIISSHSYHLVTSDINTVQPSKTVHIFSSKPTSTTTQATELSFLDAQIMIVSCSIAFVSLVVFVPLMIMYYLGKLKRSRIRQKPRDNSDNNSSSSVNFPQVFYGDFVYDNTDMGKTLPVRYHSRTLSDLPYSWNFENNWNS